MQTDNGGPNERSHWYKRQLGYTRKIDNVENLSKLCIKMEDNKTTYIDSTSYDQVSRTLVDRRTTSIAHVVRMQTGKPVKEIVNR